MEYKLIIFSRLISILFSIFIINYVRKNILNEKESLFWVLGCLCMIILTLFPKILLCISESIGIQYPPATLFLFAILIQFIILYRQFLKISALTEKVSELIKTTSIISFELEEHKKYKKEDN